MSSLSDPPPNDDGPDPSVTRPAPTTPSAATPIGLPLTPPTALPNSNVPSSVSSSEVPTASTDQLPANLSALIAGEGRRLPPVAIATWGFGRVQPIIAALFMYFIAPGPIGVSIAAITVFSAPVASVFRWLRFRWCYVNRTIVIEEGLITRKHRVIPTDRVQSVDLVRPLVHRVLGVSRVRIESIGGGVETEGVLEALPAVEAESLRRTILIEKSEMPAGAITSSTGVNATAEPGSTTLNTTVSDEGIQPVETALSPLVNETVLVTTGVPQLIVAGLTGQRIGVFAVVFGVLSQAFGERLFSALYDTVQGLAPVMIAVLAVVFIISLFVLSVATTAIANWNFTVTTDGERLTINRGLLQQQTQTVPLNRIQAVRREQSLVRRLFGFSSVHVEVAGQATGEDTASNDTVMLCGPTSQAEQLVALLLPAGAELAATASLTPPPSRAIRRAVLKSVKLPVLLMAATGIAIWAKAPVPIWAYPATLVPLTVFSLWLHIAQFRALGWTRNGDVVVSQWGAITRYRTHVPVARIQQLASKDSFFQRRRRLSDVQLGIAKSGPFNQPTIRELDIDEARVLLRHLSHDAVQLSRRRTDRSASASGEHTA